MALPKPWQMMAKIRLSEFLARAANRNHPMVGLYQKRVEVFLRIARSTSIHRTYSNCVVLESGGATNARVFEAAKEQYRIDTHGQTVNTWPLIARLPLAL